MKALLRHQQRRNAEWLGMTERERVLRECELRAALYAIVITVGTIIGALAALVRE